MAILFGGYRCLDEKQSIIFKPKHQQKINNKIRLQGGENTVCVREELRSRNGKFILIMLDASGNTKRQMLANKTFTHALVTSWLDYSNAVLCQPHKHTDGTSAESTDFYSPTSYPYALTWACKHQSRTAWLVTRTRKREHITPVLNCLHWLLGGSTGSWFTHIKPHMGLSVSTQRNFVLLSI